MKNFIKENFLRIGLLLVVLLVLISVVYFYNSSKKLEAKKQITVSQLALQERCAGAAKNFFNEDKWGRAAEDINSNNVNYTNQYNSKYNKCFVLITERFSDGSGISQVLYDVFGHKEYANGTFGSKDLSVYCTILAGDCKTISDFNKFVSEYVGN